MDRANFAARNNGGSSSESWNGHFKLARNYDQTPFLIHYFLRISLINTKTGPITKGKR
jgi:hypothetical protein